MTRSALVLCGLILVVATPAHAQTRQSFAGVWTRVVEPGTEPAPTVATVGDADFRTGEMGSGWGSPLTITQRTDSLIVEFPYFSSYDLQPPLRFAYALDGSESRNGIMISHTESMQRSRLVWDNGALTISTRYPAPRGATPDGSVEVRQTLTLESPTSLVVVTTHPHGRGAFVTTRTVYSKR